MKKLFLMLMLLAPLATFAQKFGHVDTQSIIESLPDYSRAKGEVEAIGKQYDNELQTSQAEFQRQVEDYDKKKSSMNATQQEEKEKALQEMANRIQQQAQQSQQDFQKAQQEKMQPILNDSISKDLTAEVKAQIAKMK